MDNHELRPDYPMLGQLERTALTALTFYMLLAKWEAVEPMNAVEALKKVIRISGIDLGDIDPDKIVKAYSIILEEHGKMCK